MTISSTTTRNQYTGNNSTTVFAYSFKIFADADLLVILTDTSGVETVKTLTTHYTVSGAGTDSGGNVTFTSGNTPGTGVIVTILRNTAITQSTDYVENDTFPAASHETALDRLTAIDQHQQDRIDRSLKAPDSEASGYSMTLPAKASRLGTVLGFNATSGNPEAGPKIADVSSLAAITADISTLADIEDGTDATNAIQTVAGISGNVSTVAGISANVTTVAGITSNIAAVVADATDIGVVANKADEIGRLGTSAAVTDLSILGTSDAVSDMNTLAAISSNISTVAGISSNVTTVAGVASLITSDFVSDLNTLATTDIVSDLNTLATADIVSDLNTLATSDIVSDLNTLATSDIVTDMNLLATSQVVADMAALAGSGGAPNISALTITKNSGTGVLPTLTILCSDTTAIQNQDLGQIEFQTSDTNETGTVSKILATRTNSTSDSTNEGALEFYTGRPGDLSLSMTINSDHTVTFANNITASGTVTADGLTVDTNTLHVDATNNRVGISTSSPQKTLDVRGELAISNSTTSYWNINRDDSDGSLTFTDTNVNERMRIDSSGRVLIGQSSSTGSTNADELVVGSGSGNQGITIFSGASNGSTIAFKDSGADEDGFISFNHASQFMQFGTAASEAMRIDSAQKVIIGDTSTRGTYGLTVAEPSDGVRIFGIASGGMDALHFDQARGSVASPTASSADGDGSYISFSSYDGTNFDDIGSLAVVTDGAQDAGRMIFRTTPTGGSQTERMRVDSSGNVGIGTTLSGSPAKLHIAGSSSTDFKALILRNSDGTTGSAAVLGFEASTGTLGNDATLAAQIKGIRLGSGTAGGLSFHTTVSGTPTEAMRIDSSGNLLVGKTSTALGAAGVVAYGGSSAGVIGMTNAVRPLYINKLTSDGAIIELAKDAEPVGIIGTTSGDLDIGTGDTGIQFNDAANQILPYNTSTRTTVDNAVGLGGETRRFTDLYLSGGVYLGGVTSANHLDDYEEGIWTPTLTVGSGSLSVDAGEDKCSYVKIGSLVQVQGSIGINGSGASGQFRIASLPFAMASLEEQADLSTLSVNLYNTASDISGLLNAEFSDSSGATILIREGGGTSAGVVEIANRLDSGTTIRFQGTYRTT